MENGKSKITKDNEPFLCQNDLENIKRGVRLNPRLMDIASVRFGVFPPGPTPSSAVNPAIEKETTPLPEPWTAEQSANFAKGGRDVLAAAKAKEIDAWVGLVSGKKQ